MIKKTILIVLTGILIMTSGCSGDINEGDKREAINSVAENISEEDKNEVDDAESETSNQNLVTAPSLGGISPGDTSEKVIEILGDNYSESTETDILGAYGEDIIIWNYNNGIAVSIGKTSGKVLKIASASPDFQTDLGIKVGDDAESVFETYKPVFEEPVSRHSNETLEGWFLMEDGSVMIFDFDKSDNTMVNSNITPDSSVEEIILTKWKYIN